MSADRCPCPVCGHLTLSEPAGSGSYDICPVCFWEDDPVQFSRPDQAGGANRVSLNEARSNYIKIGASDERAREHVRAPLPEEIPT